MSDAAPDLRRFLLKVKRDCYNGRPLARHVLSPHWGALIARVGPEADEVPLLEAQVEQRWNAFDDAYVEDLERETAQLATVVEDPGLRHGLALASPVLADGLGSRQLADNGDDRKRRRLRLSLLRYLSRSTVKLSPFSTLTRLALARCDGESREAVVATAPALAVVGAPEDAQDRRLVRVRRYLVEQVAAAILEAPDLADALPVELNGSLRRVGSHRVVLLPPCGWRLPSSGHPRRIVPDRPVEMELDDAVVEWLRAELRHPRSREQLRAQLAAALGGDEAEQRARQSVDRLLRIGVLIPAPPWSAADPRLEERLLEALLRLAGSPSAKPIAAALTEVLAWEERLGMHGDPALAVREVEAALEAAWQAARRAAQRGPALRLQRSKQHEVYEDVLLVGRDRAELVEARADRLEEAVRDSLPWHRLVDLYAPRHELLLTIAALAARRWPGRAQVGALELFGELMPHAREVRSLLGASPQPRKEGPPPFDPLGLPEIAALARRRHRAWEELRRRMRTEGGEARLERQDLQELAASLPAEWLPPGGPCLFLQPADEAGELWVLNRIFEGTGRYGSRFLPLLPGHLQQSLAAMLAEVPRTGEGAAEPVELMWGQGDTLNVHPVQTRRVVTLPGEPSPVPANRRLDVSSLRVDVAGPVPRLLDGDGTLLLPVVLGGAALSYAPPLLAFLAQLGPGELRPIQPPRTSCSGQGALDTEVRCRERVVCGRLVLARRRWIVPKAPLEEIYRRPAGRALAALTDWRRSCGIPSRVFLIEKVRFGSGQQAFKPQFLDLRSPSFSALLETVLPNAGESLIFEEMLPCFDAYARDSTGRRWAIELLVDTVQRGAVAITKGSDP